MNALLPNTPMGPTSVGKSNRSDVIYSAVVLQHGGVGPVRAFTVARGSTIPALRSSAISAPSQVWQLTYDDHATNLTQAGVFGDGIGDVAVRAIGLDLEQAPITNTSGAAAAYGATEKEVSDIESKMSFSLKLLGNEVTKGWLGYFPAFGGVTGSISTTGNSQTASIVSNGVPGMGNFYDFPILIGAGNTVEAVLSTGAGASLAFTTTTGDGQPLLCRIGLRAFVGRDIIPT